MALQPSTVALALVLLGAVLRRWRRRGLPVLAWCIPGALLTVPFLAGSPTAPSSASPAALLLSPAKGALVFAPVALVGLAGLLRALRAPARRLWDQPQPGRFLPLASAVAAAAHFACLALTGSWAAPDFWGPRWVAPAWPLLLLFVPEGFMVLKVGASLLAIVSVGIQALGAVTYDDESVATPNPYIGKLDGYTGVKEVKYHARKARYLAFRGGPGAKRRHRDAIAHLIKPTYPKRTNGRRGT